MIMKAGTILHGPDGQGYRLTRDFNVGDVATAYHFEPVGGAPEPVAGEVMPSWLAKHFSVGIPSNG